MNILSEMDKPKYQIIFKGIIHHISKDFQQFSLSPDQFTVVLLMRQRQKRAKILQILRDLAVILTKNNYFKPEQYSISDCETAIKHSNSLWSIMEERLAIIQQI